MWQVQHDAWHLPLNNNLMFQSMLLSPHIERYSGLPYSEYPSCLAEPKLTQSFPLFLKFGKLFSTHGKMLRVWAVWCVHLNHNLYQGTCLLMTGCHVIYNEIICLQPRHKVHKGTEFGVDLLSYVVTLISQCVQCIIVFFCCRLSQWLNLIMSWCCVCFSML